MGIDSDPLRAPSFEKGSSLRSGPLAASRTAMIRVSTKSLTTTLGGAVLLLGYSSGASKKEAVHLVVQMAQFDLDCPRSEIRYTKKP